MTEEKGNNEQRQTKRDKEQNTIDNNKKARATLISRVLSFLD